MRDLTGDQRRDPYARTRARATIGSVLAICLAALEPLPALAQSGPGETFHVSKVDAVGGEGSWDYVQFDPATDRLFVARVGGVLALDVRSMKPVGTIPALAGTRVHGVALAEDLGLGMTGNGADKTSTVFDLKTLRTTAEVALPYAADAVTYDGFSHAAIAVGADDPHVMAFDPKTGKLVADLKMPGSPEASVPDGHGQLYVTLSDTNEVGRIDTRSWTVADHWAVGGGCEEPTPIAMDTARGRLFVGCRSKVLVVVDPGRRTPVAVVPIGEGVDSLAFDPARGLIFVSCNDGTVTVIAAQGASSYSVAQTVKTQAGARTMALDPGDDRLFLPAADKGPMLPKVGDIPGRPAIVPETFRILTVSR